MTDPLYEKRPGETWKEYRRRIRNLTPPDFAHKLEVGPVPPDKQGKKSLQPKHKGKK
jgi:hypothetical protein